jgi:hypothetical protein
MQSDIDTQKSEVDEAQQMRDEDEKSVLLEVEGPEEQGDGGNGWPWVRAHSLLPDDCISQHPASGLTAFRLTELDLRADTVETAVEKVNAIINESGTGDPSGTVLWRLPPPDESINDMYDAYGADVGEVDLVAVARGSLASRSHASVANTGDRMELD